MMGDQKMNRLQQAESLFVKLLVVVVSVVGISLIAAAPAKAAPVRVGIVSGGSASAANLASQLNDDTFFDFNAVVISPSDADTAIELAAYDVVILGDSGNSDNGYSAQMLAAIRAWMDSGAGVVTVGWYVYGANSYAGQTFIDADYITPINLAAGAGYDFQSDGIFHLDTNTHPITNGITDFPINGCCLEYDTALDSGAFNLGSPGSNPSGYALAYQEINGRSVYLGNLYLASTGYSQEPYTRTGIQDRLLEQAVFWAANGYPSASTVPAMNEWGIIIFVLLAGLGSVYYLKKQRRADV